MAIFKDKPFCKIGTSSSTFLRMKHISEDMGIPMNDIELIVSEQVPFDQAMYYETMILNKTIEFRYFSDNEILEHKKTNTITDGLTEFRKIEVLDKLKSSISMISEIKTEVFKILHKAKKIIKRKKLKKKTNLKKKKVNVTFPTKEFDDLDAAINYMTDGDLDGNK